MPKPSRKLEIFPSPRASLEKTVRRVTLQTSLRSVLREQAVFEEKEETVIVPSLRAYRFLGLENLRSMKK